MTKIITYNFTEDFISNLADYIEKNFLQKGTDLSRIAIVFGGKRPSLFLKRELSKRIKRNFFPPQFFSIDEFVNFIVSKKGDFRIPSDLESSYMIYNSGKKISSEILHGKEKFSEFIPLAKEIAGFIDELDIENIQTLDLKPVEIIAEIGYEVPENINKTLQHIVKLRDLYHLELRKRNLLSRGLIYHDASRYIKGMKFPEFDKILFCNFYYLHQTEKEVFKHLLEKELAIAFFQKDSNPSSVFNDLSGFFNHKIEPDLLPITYHIGPKISIYKGFDSHSQVALVREILNSEIKRDGVVNKTVIVLPDTNNLIPLLSEVSSCVEDFNVSMGYPLKRSALYSLLKFIFRAQSTHKDGNYYTKDYLKVLLHPLIKNLRVTPDPASTRILVHKVEEVLMGTSPAPPKNVHQDNSNSRRSGARETNLSGSLFIKLDDIENLNELYQYAGITMAHMDINISPLELKNILKAIHSIAFKMWEDIATFSQFTTCMEKFNEILLSKSSIGNFPLNTEILERIFTIIDELKNIEFKNEPFKKEDIFKIFDNKLKGEMVSFSGSPLKGLQILGLFETRSLNFENVIIMDVNETILPRLKIYEPLIPRQIMESLGLQRLKQEEEIQRYHFRRLISGAKNIYFVYDGSPEKEKSRFLEEIIWQKQKEEKRLDVISESTAKFNVANIPSTKNKATKNDQIIKYFARDFVYSSSSIDIYLNCPMKFYYQYVLRLQEKEDLLNEVEARDIGTFIHEFLDHSFRKFLDKKPVIDENFEKGFFEEFEKRFSKELRRRLGPEAFLVKEVMKYRLKKFLEKEKERGIEKVLSLEEERPAEKIKLSNKAINFKYRIDRIDLVENNTILVIDYKTGTSARAPRIDRIETMEFNRKSIKENIHSFQLPIYFYFVKERYKDFPINAALYNLQDLNFTEFKPTDESMNICIKALDFIIDEILNPEIGFQPDNSSERNCQYCEFFGMC